MYNNKLGLFVICFDEIEAIHYSLKSARKIYPDIPIYLNCEGEENSFDFLQNDIVGININYVEDTFSNVLLLNEENFRDGNNQQYIKIATLALINRLCKAIPFLNSEYILLHCSDTLIRGTLTIPENTHFLGSRVNNYFFQEINNILVKNGGITVTAFGGCPAIFKTDDFLIAKDKFVSLIDELCYNCYAVFTQDIFMSIIFALIGKEEQFNPDIVECGRNSLWEHTNCPLVHQFRNFYPQRKGKYAINSK